MSAATTTTKVSRNALHATTTLGSSGRRARRSRSPAQRFGHAETWTTTAIHARTRSPKTGAESGTGRIHRPAADEHQKSATLAANRTAALRSSRAQRSEEHTSELQSPYD